MAGTKGFAAVAKLARRTSAQRGGNEEISGRNALGPIRRVDLLGKILELI